MPILFALRRREKRAGAARMNEIAERIHRLIEPCVKTRSMTVYDVEAVGSPPRKLVIYLDMEGGVGIDALADISRTLAPLIEAEGGLTEPYALEVSSPGLTRALKRPEHYKSAIGSLANIKFTRSSPLAARHGGVARARIIDATDDGIALEGVDGIERVEIGYDEISRARLEFEA